MARIATGLGLALLLLVGAWSAPHAAHEKHPAAAQMFGADLADEPAPTAIAPFVEDAVPAGMVACALGAFCVLLVALVRTVRRRGGILFRMRARLRAPVPASARPALPVRPGAVLSVVSRT